MQFYWAFAVFDSPFRPGKSIVLEVPGRFTSMKSKLKPSQQRSLLFPTLAEQCDPRQPLKKLADAIAWDKFEDAFSDYYSEVGRPAKPIRLLVGLLLLK